MEFKENGDGKAVRPFCITFPEQPSQEQSASKGKRKVIAHPALHSCLLAFALPCPADMLNLVLLVDGIATASS